MSRLSERRANKFLAKEQYYDHVADIFARVQKKQKVYHVGSVDGDDAFSGRSVYSQVATLQGALDKVTASQGDVILVSPFHQETVTSVLTLDKIATRIQGLKCGNMRPQITVNGAIDLFSLEAAACELRGLHLKISTTDSATAMVNMAAAKCKVSDLYIEPSAACINVLEVFTVTADADDCVIGGDSKEDTVTIYNKLTPVTAFLEFEGACSNFKIRNFNAFGDVATAGITDSAKVDYLHLEDVSVAVVGSSKPAVTLNSNPEGLARNCFFAGTVTTLASNAALGNLMRIDNVKVLEETDGSASAAIIPAVDSDC